MLYEVITAINDILGDLKFEIVNYFDELVQSVLGIGERVVGDRYVIRSYIEVHEDNLSAYGKDIRRQYRRLISQLDEFAAIRKARQDKSESFILQAVL